MSLQAVKMGDKSFGGGLETVPVTENDIEKMPSNQKINAAYKRIVNSIADEGIKLLPGEYEEFVGEVTGYLHAALSDCNKDEKHEND